MGKPFIRYKDGFKYCIEGDYAADVGIFPDEDIRTKYVSLTKAGRLTIRDGFANDGPSGPTIDTKTGMRAAFEHDALCYLMREGLLPRTWYHACSDRFHKVLLEDGMWRPRAWWWFKGVDSDIARASALKPRKIYTAP